MGDRKCLGCGALLRGDELYHCKDCIDEFENEIEEAQEAMEDDHG